MLRIVGVEQMSTRGDHQMLTPALYRTRFTHLRRSPVHHYNERSSYSWYVDVDAMPRVQWWLRPSARFEAADHFTGADSETLRQRVDAFLADNGIYLNGGRVTALLMPRVLGRALPPGRASNHGRTRRKPESTKNRATPKSKRASIAPNGPLTTVPVWNATCVPTTMSAATARSPSRSGRS